MCHSELVSESQIKSQSGIVQKIYRLEWIYIFLQKTKINLNFV